MNADDMTKSLSFARFIVPNFQLKLRQPTQLRQLPRGPGKALKIGYFRLSCKIRITQISRAGQLAQSIPPAPVSVAAPPNARPESLQASEPRWQPPDASARDRSGPD